MISYIGAASMISPLGLDIETTWNAISLNRTGIAWYPNAGFSKAGVHLAKIPLADSERTFDLLLERCLVEVLLKIDANIIESDRTLILISSTKGAINQSIQQPFERLNSFLMSRFGLKNQPIVISNACISGVLAINTADGYLQTGQYDHVIVVGCDIISDFVLYGFQSLFAISEQPCRPFDADRNGITLGEGCAAVVVSNNKAIFENAPLQLLAGASANDANHISGPSRTGEGLFRAVTKTLIRNKIDLSQIDFINAHGTATKFNDEMEAIAFNRLGLGDKPVNSLKGYFGHTLGAAGIMETVVSMQMLHKNVLLKSLGYEHHGTSQALNVITQNKSYPNNCFLKTASGFGGGNAALIIQKI